jgi:WD40 repeat protein
VAFHPDGWALVSGGRHNGDVKVWDLTRMQEYRALRAMNAQGLGFDSGGTLRLVDAFGQLQAYDTNTQTLKQGPVIDLTQDWITPARLAEFSRDGTRVATVPRDRQVVKVWDSASGRQIAALRGLQSSAMFVNCDGTGRRVAAIGMKSMTVDPDRDIRIWDVSTGRVLAAYRAKRFPDRYVHGAVCLNATGTMVAFDDYDQRADGSTATRIRLCELPGGRALRSLPFHGRVCALTFSDDGTLLSAASIDGGLAIWDVQTGTPVVNHARIDPPLYQVSFSADGRRLAGVSREKLRVWEVAEGRELLELHISPRRAFDGGYNPSVAWSPDLRLLVNSNWDGSLAFWDGPEVPPSQAERRADAVDHTLNWHLAELRAARAAGQSDAVAFHLARVRAGKPRDIPTALSRGYLLLNLGLHREAARDFARWFESGEPDEGLAWLAYARILLTLQNVTEYRRLCERIVIAADHDPPQVSLIKAARILGLAPGPRPERARDLAKRSMSFQSVIDRPNAYAEYLGLALVQYRNGQYEEGIASVEHFIKKVPDQAWSCWPALAMLTHKAGHPEEARSWLAKAEEKSTAMATAPRSAVAPISGNEAWLEFQLLLTEARELLSERAAQRAQGSSQAK